MLLCTLLLFSCGEDKDLSLKKQYPGGWYESFNTEITKALIAGQIKGCGEYKYKRHAKTKSKYLVRCTRDGETWVTYLISTRNGVTGPHTPNALLN